MKLKKIAAGGLLMLMTLAAVFVLRDQVQEEAVVDIEPETVPEAKTTGSVSPEMSWTKTPARIMRTYKDGDAYYALVAVGDTHYRAVLPIGPLEFRILERDDTVDLMYIEKNGSEIDYIDWVRDVHGRLDIHETRPIVVVDAGHGGWDHGEGSNDLWLEKDMVLTMAFELKAQLEGQGIRAVMTRQDDHYIDLYDRATIANYIEADVFVSCHINKVSWDASGVEVLYSQKADADYAAALATAVAGEDFSVFRVYNRKSEDLKGTDYYFVHKYCDCPSYILEFGFAHNEEDSAYIEANWQTLVRRTSDSIGAHILVEDEE